MVIHAGDVSKTGRDHEVEDFMRWFSALDYKYKVFIAGNHDFFFENETTKSIARFLNGNTFYLFNSTIEIEGLKIWGSPFTPTFFNWAFNHKRRKDIQMSRICYFQLSTFGVLVAYLIRKVRYRK